MDDYGKPNHYGTMYLMRPPQVYRESACEGRGPTIVISTHNKINGKKFSPSLYGFGNRSDGYYVKFFCWR